MSEKMTENAKQNNSTEEIRNKKSIINND